MARVLSVFRSPAARPRLIAWSFAAIAITALLMGASMAMTSTAWFCNDVCHVVHKDNAKAYFASSHSKVSCMACHYPVGLQPAGFTLDRMDKLLDIMPAIQGDFEMPLNGDSHLALTFADSQCTQCHNMPNREATPTYGVRINHGIHTEKGIVCTACHNRVAHPEETIEFELPNNGPKANFMKMTACYRCHSLTNESPSDFWAPGQCGKCHGETFDLVPDTHDAANWYADRGDSSGHAGAATEEASQTAEAIEHWDEEKVEFYEKGPRVLVRMAGIDESLKTDVPPPATINECFTCHVREEFCDSCHGVQVPHPAEFVEKHGTELSSAKDAVSCAVCHNKTGDAKNDAATCALCHHPGYDPASTQPWRTQHDEVVRRDGAPACFQCHEETFCSHCHVEQAMQD